MAEVLIEDQDMGPKNDLTTAKEEIVVHHDVLSQNFTLCLLTTLPKDKNNHTSPSTKNVLVFVLWPLTKCMMCEIKGEM